MYFLSIIVFIGSFFRFYSNLLIEGFEILIYSMERNRLLGHLLEAHPFPMSVFIDGFQLVVETFVLRVLLFFYNVFCQVWEFAAKVVVFLRNLQLNVRMIAPFLVVGFFQGSMNDEILVTFCFVVALCFLYSMLGDSIAEVLDERSEGIRKELSTFLLLKQENLNDLYASEQSLLNTTQNLAILQNYCQEHFVDLDQTQEKALTGLVAQNLHAKLEALQVIKKSLQPTLHAQMNASFREAVIEVSSKTKNSNSIYSIDIDAISQGKW